MILDVARKMLRALGYDVLTAGSGAEALELFGRQGGEIALVILDIVMPDMGGVDLFNRLKKRSKDVKTLISSGYSVAGQATQLLNRGSNGFIQKPFTLQQLSQKIREILDPQDQE
jgi:CheY-like chemotaxis protein